MKIGWTSKFNLMQQLSRDLHFKNKNKKKNLRNVRVFQAT